MKLSLVVLFGAFTLGFSSVAKADLKWIEVINGHCPDVCQHDTKNYKFVRRFARHFRQAEEGICASFVEGTPVYAEGHKNVAIEAIQQGDKLYAYDKKAGTIKLHEVTALFDKTVNEIVTITTTGGETIKTTAEHPFWVYEKGWIPAEYLNSRYDKLIDVQSMPVGIQSVEVTSLEQPVTVHNFTVDKAHTYYVSYNRVLVHNSNCGDSAKLAKALFMRGAAK